MTRIAAAFLLGLLLAGEAPAADPAASVLTLEEGLPSLRGWARIDLVLGRLRVSCGRSTGQSTATVEHEQGIVETYTLQIARGVATTHYSAVGPIDSIVTVIDGETARLSYERDATPQVVLEQRAEGPVVLTHLVGGKAQRIRAATIWHLLLVAPEEPRAKLLAMLRLYRRDWDVERKLAETVQAMSVLPSGTATPSTRELADLLAEAGAPTFAARREAQRQLTAVGQAAYPFLISLDPRELDAQQRLTRRDLLADLARGGADSPERVALWLSGDTSIWTLLAERGTPPQQAAARRRLGGPLAETASALDAKLR